MELKQYPTIKIEVEKLKPNNFNPKKDLNDLITKRQYEDLKKSLKHGYLLDILVRETDEGLEIVDGYHRYLALKEMGVKEITVRNLGKISRSEAIKKALSVEKVKIPLDEIMTAELLAELVKESDLQSLAENLPFTEEELANKIKLLEFDWDDEDNIPASDGLSRFVVADQPEVIKEFLGYWNEIKAGTDLTDGKIILEMAKNFLKI